MMTADDRRTAFDLVAAALRKLRGYWIVFTFALGAFLWAWDTWQAHAPMPGMLEAQSARLDRLERQIAIGDATSTLGPRAGFVPRVAPWLVLTLDRPCGGEQADQASGPVWRRP